MPLFDKPTLRREMRQRLAALEDRAEKSHALCAQIAAHPAYAAARVVALFDAMPAEPHVELLWTLAPRRFVYPRIEGEHLHLHEAPTLAALIAKPGARFREPEADPARRVEPAEIDVILVPGLAFTSTGLRIGRGGGYYDRLLALLSPRTVKLGVCFGCQLVEELPVEPHDVRLDAVLTELPPPPTPPLPPSARA